MDYRTYMQEAIAEAKAAAAAGEVPVGAILVAEDKIIVRAGNLTESDNTAMAHAELIAIRRAEDLLGRKNLGGCTLFVTMEPCPMCAGAIILARVGRVVFGCPDSRFGACGSVFNLPAHPMAPYRPQVIGGICEDECKQLLQQFFLAQRRD